MKTNSHAVIIAISTLLLTATILHGQDENTNGYETGIGISLNSNLSHVGERKSQSFGGSWGVELDFLNQRNGIGFYTGLGYTLINIGNEGGLTPSSESSNVKLLEVPFGFIYRITNDELSYGGLQIDGGLSFALIEETHRVQVEDGKYSRIKLNMGISYRQVIQQEFGIQPQLKISYLDIPNESVQGTLLIALGVKFLLLK